MYVVFNLALYDSVSESLPKILCYTHAAYVTFKDSMSSCCLLISVQYSFSEFFDIVFQLKATLFLLAFSVISNPNILPTT